MRLIFQVIASELYRNVLLAAVVIFFVTSVIIANPVTSCLVFLCVVFTVVSPLDLSFNWFCRKKWQTCPITVWRACRQYTLRNLTYFFLTIQVDVTGLMYFWGLTIDMVSTIVLVIAVGLSVDYASHVGHAFLVQTGTTDGNIITT